MGGSQEPNHRAAVKKGGMEFIGPNLWRKRSLTEYLQEWKGGIFEENEGKHYCRYLGRT